VLHVVTAAETLFSTHGAEDDGLYITYDTTVGYRIYANADQTELLAKTTKVGRLHALILQESLSLESHLERFGDTFAKIYWSKSKTERSDLELWHRRLGCLGEHNLRKLGKMTDDGLKFRSGDHLTKACSACAFAKNKRAPVMRDTSKKIRYNNAVTERVLGRIHTDIGQGPSKTKAITGERFYCLLGG
jgi:hypothetical protein